MAIERVSLTDSDKEANDQSFLPSISLDGRYVVFESYATNLVSGDINANKDVFVRDRVSGTTTQVSVSSAEVGGNKDSIAAQISSDGQWVAFQSASDNLVSGDSGYYDVFLRDLVGGNTVRVSVNKDGLQADNDSFDPAISADGQFVAFTSRATDLTATKENNGEYDIYVRDMVAGTNEYVSVDSSETGGNGASTNASISADGNLVVFQSVATNLVGSDGNLASDIFLRDRGAGVTLRVSVADDEQEANESSWDGDIGANGTYVVFTSSATNLIGTGKDGNGVADIFLRDTLFGTTERISVSKTGGDADGESGLASVSSDGRFVVFWSDATNLIEGDTNGKRDIFVRDRAAGATFRVSEGVGATQGNADALAAAMSADGIHYAFSSEASNLVSGDKNTVADIFYHSNPALDAIPVIAGGDAVSYSLAEPWPVVADLVASDDIDSEEQGLTYTIVNTGVGEDGALFTISAGSGVLVFREAPDHGNPRDSDKNNSYGVIVRVTDSDGHYDEQSIAVYVTDATGHEIIGTSGNDIIAEVQTVPGQDFPSAGEDWIYGNEGDDRLCGLAGNDFLDGGEGNDIELNGGLGNDVLQGDTGDDYLSGEDGSDVLLGGDGNDIILGGTKGEADTLVGGKGNDHYFVDSLGDVVIEEADSGWDSLSTPFTTVLSGSLAHIDGLYLDGTASVNGTGNGLDNALFGNSGNNVLDGGDGDDWLEGQEGQDTMIGGAGNDLFNDQRFTADVMIGGSGNDQYRVDHKNDVVTELPGDTFDQVHAWISYVLPDEIEVLQLQSYKGVGALNGTGNNNANIIGGNDLSNLLVGLGGDDEITADWAGAAGNDTLDGGDGADYLDGGDGVDTATYASDTAGVTVDLELVGIAQTSAGQANGDRLFNIENLIGGAAGDILSGDGGANLLTGGTGNDTLTGRGGDDTLTGSAGQDYLTGGSGLDLFDFNKKSETKKGLLRDVITDFAQGEDRIDLKTIDARTDDPGNDKFRWIGTQKFHHRSGELHYKVVGTDVVVEGDVNGDGRADFQIEVDNLGVLAKTDFIL